MNQLFVNIINKFCMMDVMNKYNNNSNSSWKEVDIHQLSAKETVGTIQNVSKNIREYSLRMRETMKTLRESDSIPEMAEAIREGSFAIRDTMRDINEATQELKRNSVLVDTANAVENTLGYVEESITAVREITFNAGNALPRTTKTVQYGIDTVKNETNQMTGKVMATIKNKVDSR